MTNGLVVMTPTTVAKTGASSTATINADGSVTFGLCESLSLNGVFTGDYDNYMVAIRHVQTGGTSNFYGRFRVGGVDNTTASSYTSQELNAYGTTVNANRGSYDFGYFPTSSSGTHSASTIYFFGPYLTQPTPWRQVTANGYLSAAIFDTAGTHNQSVSYDGFSFTAPSPRDISGLLTVFGFNQ